MSEPQPFTKTVLLGITGGIAAFKTPQLIRSLKQSGYRVIPVLTKAAQQFVTSHTLAAVSGEQVRDNLWDQSAELAMGHIELARLADLMVIAPATAHVIGKLANGLADDLLSTVYLATKAKVLIAPSMNQQMFLSESVQRNLATLRESGVLVIGPNEGDQACGDTGPGRMSEPDEIVELVEGLLDTSSTPPIAVNHALKGAKVLVTAGPTRESIDPVRYLSNASSGRQGFAIARAAQQHDAEVILVAGPVSLNTPPGVQRIDVKTAHEMFQAVDQNLESCDLFFSVAAVADYKPRTTYLQKIKKTDAKSSRLVVELEATVDIVHDVAQREKKPFLIGFAAETTNIEEFAREKRVRKGLDVIILNDVSRNTIGFDSENNEVILIHANGEVTLPFDSKESIAHKILDEVSDLWVEAKSQNTLSQEQAT